MARRGERRLPDGRTVAVNHNEGVRKICGCPRRVWPKCRHPWHFSFQAEGVNFRFSLDRYARQTMNGKTEAEALAERLRADIRDDMSRAVASGEEAAVAQRIRESIRARTYPARLASPGAPTGVVPPTKEPLSFKAFAKIWDERWGYQLVRPRDNRYRIGVIASFVLPGTNPPVTFGTKDVNALVPADIDAFRHSRKAEGLSAVTVNHDLKLLRKMFNWGLRNGYLHRSPFKIGGESAISLDRETPRDRRFRGESDEKRLLAAANSHLRSVIIAILDTCCRPGEVLSLQWRDVDLEAREIFIRPAKTKTRVGRFAPISARLLATLEVRRLDPVGKQFGPEAYVFGNEAGEKVKSVRTAWENACKRAGLDDFHLADLRHEAASTFEEAGVPISHVSRILGHANLSTTTRYLNSSHRWLRLAAEKLNARKGESQKEERDNLETENPESLASSLQDPAGTLSATPRTKLVSCWCERRDSNSHALASASPSSWCVCQFRHFREGGGCRVDAALSIRVFRVIRGSMIRAFRETRGSTFRVFPCNPRLYFFSGCPGVVGAAGGCPPTFGAAGA